MSALPLRISYRTKKKTMFNNTDFCNAIRFRKRKTKKNEINKYWNGFFFSIKMRPHICNNGTSTHTQDLILIAAAAAAAAQSVSNCNCRSHISLWSASYTRAQFPLFRIIKFTNGIKCEDSARSECTAREIYANEVHTKEAKQKTKKEQTNEIKKISSSSSRQISCSFWIE